MIVAIDLETTGVDYKKDKIIEIALVKFDENTFDIIEEFTTLVYPEIPIPELISNITNIFDDDVFASPTIDELVLKVRDFIGNLPILGHNVNFDKNFLVQNGVNIENNIVIDTFFLANFISYKEKSLNLEFICISFGYSFIGAHRALNDVKATIFLFEKLLFEFDKLSELAKNLLYYLFLKSNDLNIDYIKTILFKRFKILDLSFELFEKAILEVVGKYSFDENMQKEEVKNERKKQVKNENFEKIYKSLGNIEKRDNQLKMTNLVYETLNKGNKSVIEAPTGIGKSFAYLIPSVIFSIKSGQKVFVSTKTKALQDQLYFKDLDFLSTKLGFDFSYTKIKGKSNYFCLKGFFDEINEYDIEYEKVGFLSKITLWLFESEYGELDDLNYYGKEYFYLKYINSDNLYVLKEQNPYKNWEFLYKARQKLNTSDIIIINHSLLFSDIGLENSNLGTIKNLVIDEAHNIEDSVTESLRKKFSKNNLEEIFNTVEKILVLKKIKKIDFLNKKDNIVDKVSLLLDYCLVYINKKNQNNNFNSGILIRKDFFDEIDLKELLMKLSLDFIDIIDILITLSTIHEIDLSREVTSIQNISQIINIVFDKDTTNIYIPIVSYYENSGVIVEYTLLNPGQYLEENIWIKLDSLIMTSATLKIGDNFDYLKQILSLKDPFFNFFTYSSEFDYKKQATLFIPNDLGSIKNNSKTVVNFLKSFYEIVRGKTLTLFTSFYSIREVYTELNFYLKKLGISLYPQGIGGGKNKLINFYLENSKNSILLGTDSFWEGIDIPGDNLKYLVIHKIPFMVPNDPIFLARSALFKNAFLEYSIPKSIIKLKQGFGRLIRSKKDTGIVILLDDRIFSTDWGNMFYKAFPSEINTKLGSSKVFLDLLNKNNN